MRESTSKENRHIRLLDDSEFPATFPSLRYVKVADKIFAFRPDTCFKHVLSHGGDYYPYYDDDLTTATRAEVLAYHDHDDEYIWGDSE